MAQSAVERGADSRQRLLRATAAVIARDGWGAVTTRRVADEAGLTSGLVHYHFASVDDLRRQATVEALDRFLVPVLEHLEASGDFTGTLTDLLGELSAMDHPDAPEVALLYEAFLAAFRDDAIRAELARALARFRQQTAQLLRRAGAEEPDDLAVLAAAAIDGVLLHALIDPDLDPTRIVAPLSRLLPSGGPL